MNTKTFYSRFLMLVVAALACLVAHADNNFYLDNVRIPATAVGNEITIPVKASFDTYVSIWDVQFSFPEGVTPIGVRRGNDMNLNYCDDEGVEHISQAQIVTSSDKTRYIGVTSFVGDYQPNEYGEYDFCGNVKWSAGQYNEMMLLTLRVEEWFGGGEIIINTKTTCGLDTRNEYNSLTPSTPEYVDWHWPGDANHDGNTNIADFTFIIDYLIGNTDYFCSQCGNVVQDDAIDILDVSKLMDYLMTEEWYDGYVMTEAQTVSSILEPAINYFYLDDVSIPATAVGGQITIPVKASFDTYVSIWDVQFSFPDGLTLIGLRRGNDMNLNYCDDEGVEHISQAQIVASSDKTRYIGVTSFVGDYQPNEYGEYDFCGNVKWNAGQYDEMMLLTLRVEEWFGGGEIIINTKTTCGLDIRNEYNILVPSTPEYVDWHWPGDVNHDGITNIADFTIIIDYLIGYTDDICSQCGNVVQDDAIDILDVSKLMDYLMTGEWYDGYILTQAEKVINVSETTIYGDVNGDGFITISDVTVLIDMLLNQDNIEYNELIDVNGDGYITIVDVTALIDMLLNQ